MALLMMGCFLGVLGVGVFFAWMIRQHNRQQQRSGTRKRDLDARLDPFCVPNLLPLRWLAVRSSNGPWLREFLRAGPTVPWQEALFRTRERRLFVSPPFHGWTLILGAGLPDPAEDVDALFRCLQRLSAEVGEVQFFTMDRVLASHGWARFRNGRAQRAYVWAGEVLWNEGAVTPEERQLDLRCRDYGDTPSGWEYGRASSDADNTDRVPQLAGRWGVDFNEASQVFLIQDLRALDEDEDGGAGDGGAATPRRN